ncbi:unnamed protein product [Lathyrus sativus]|nr:unnamed protein product [Lathyrus sativus]
MLQKKLRDAFRFVQGYVARGLLGDLIRVVRCKQCSRCGIWGAVSANGSKNCTILQGSIVLAHGFVSLMILESV